MQEQAGVIANRNGSGNTLMRDARALGDFLVAGRHLLALLAAALCFLILVNGGIQQLQMLLTGGQMLVGNVLPKVALCLVVLLGCFLRPRLDVGTLPTGAWLLCIGFLLFEVFYFTSGFAMSLGDVLTSYYDYYAVLLLAPLLLVFRGGVQERVLVQLTVVIFSICAMLGFAQYLTDNPILYTESASGSFAVASWDFNGAVRAFSFFQSALEFGAFCALCGALGIALSKATPIRGILLLGLSGLACYCTLTRLCYIIFICTCVSTLIFTYGKKPSRGLWHPLLFFWLGIATIVFSLNTFVTGDEKQLADAGSLIERVTQWGFYSDLLLHSSLTKQLLGSGIVQSEKVGSAAPMTIDSSPLALVLHIGSVGAVLFSVLIFKMWLWLRKEALAHQQPFVVAVAGFWATLACAGIFNLVFSLYGTAFALAILCSKTVSTEPLRLLDASSLLARKSGLPKEQRS